jgi:hypothetical protein
MGNNLPEDMVYSITSGFYPQLFSQFSGKFFSKKGRGRKGMQWAPKGGFSQGSLKKVQGKPKLQEEWIGEFFGKIGKGKSWKKTFGGLDTSKQSELETQAAEHNISADDMEGRLSKSKFLGSTETYKLWGSRVWYQAGQRENKPLMDEAVTEWQEWVDKKFSGKDLAKYLTTQYSKQEPFLVAMAMEMANDIFKGALDESNLREDIESVGTESDVPEEERKERPAGTGGSEKVEAIPASWTTITQARQADIKYRMENGTTVYMDSTEMPIHEAGQHGILGDTNKELVAAINAVKEGGEEAVAELRVVVHKMFIANIKTYNKDLLKLVKGATGRKGAGKTKGMLAIQKLLGDITKANKKKPKGEKPVDVRASVKQVAKIMYGEQAMLPAQETSLKYVMHTIANLAGEANANFRQGHLVGLVRGKNMYASVPMKLGQTSEHIPEFLTKQLALSLEFPDGILMLRGENHVLAFMEKDRELGSRVMVETKARQIQAFQSGRVVGVAANGQLNAAGEANVNIRTRCRPTTSVVFNPKSLERWFRDIPSLVADNVNPEIIQERGAKFMKGKRRHKISQNQGMPKNSAKFWALPYVGLMEYPTKTEH